MMKVSKSKALFWIEPLTKIYELQPQEISLYFQLIFNYLLSDIEA